MGRAGDGAPGPLGDRDPHPLLPGHSAHEHRRRVTRLATAPPRARGGCRRGYPASTRAGAAGAELDNGCVWLFSRCRAVRRAAHNTRPVVTMASALSVSSDHEQGGPSRSTNEWREMPEARVVVRDRETLGPGDLKKPHPDPVRLDRDAHHKERYGETGGGESRIPRVPGQPQRSRPDDEERDVWLQNEQCERDARDRPPLRGRPQEEPAKT